MACWTLWQRMPPRYQLTMRDSRTDEQDVIQTMGTASRSSSATPRSPRLRTPRGTKRAVSARARLSQDSGVMLTSEVLPEDYPTDVEISPQSSSLPPRSSPYISNMKNQMRINSAKRKFDEGSFSFTSPSTLSYTPKPRATTAPAFPITKLSNTDEYHRITSPSPRDQDPSPVHSPRHLQSRVFSGNRLPFRPSTGETAARDCRHVTVSTLSPFTELREDRAQGPTSPVHQRGSPTQQHCAIGNYQVATLYVDKGRVTFFRKTKPDVTQSVYSAISPYNVSRDDGSYLSHLRKAYLSGVRDLPKTNHKEPDLEKHTTIRERMDYDRKVGRILDYYTKADIPKVHVPRPPAGQYSAQSTHAVYGQQNFRTINSRGRTYIATADSEPVSTSLEDTRIEFPTPRSFTPLPQQTQIQVSARDAGGFVRINARARLHDRHHYFYLRTPAGPKTHRGKDPPDMSHCACGMCRLEMEVALMAQLNQDLGVSVDAIPVDHVGSDLGNNASTTSRNNGAIKHTVLKAVTEEDQCPARPNSVSDSRHPAASVDVSTMTVQGEQTANTPDNSSSGPSSATSATSAEKPSGAEAASLTVTLPVIEESNEVPLTVKDTKTEASAVEGTAKESDVLQSTTPTKHLSHRRSATVPMEKPTSARNSLYVVEEEPVENTTEIEDMQIQSSSGKQSEFRSKLEIMTSKEETNCSVLEQVINTEECAARGSGDKVHSAQDASESAHTQEVRTWEDETDVLLENMKTGPQEISDAEDKMSVAPNTNEDKISVAPNTNEDKISVALNTNEDKISVAPNTNLQSDLQQLPAAFTTSTDPPTTQCCAVPESRVADTVDMTAESRVADTVDMTAESRVADTVDMTAESRVADTVDMTAESRVADTVDMTAERATLPDSVGIKDQNNESPGAPPQIIISAASDTEII